MCDKTCHCSPPLWGLHSPVQVQPCCVCLRCRWPEHRHSSQLRSSSACGPEGTCGSTGGCWKGAGWLCPAVLHTVLGLQTCCFSRPEPGLEENSPKGSIAAADGYCWASYFCRFWWLHVGCQFLLDCKRHEHPSVKMFCLVLCWLEPRRPLEVFKENKKSS